MAYNQAISDGADIIDCPVQMTQDGVPFCLGSINLIERTTAAQSFPNLSISIPKLNVQNGIYAFNLTWSQIQDLQRKSKAYVKFYVSNFLFESIIVIKKGKK